MKRLPWVICCFLLAAGILTTHVTKGERLTRFVTDRTKSLTETELAILEERLSEFEKTSSMQLVVVVVLTVGGGSIEEAALRVAEENGIGSKDRNNGVLLFVAKDDRQLRIEVGYGLEGVLTDAIAGQIIRREIVPRFQQGQFYDGIRAGVDAIIAVTQHEYAADSPDRKSKRSNILLLVVIAACAFFFSSRFRRRRFVGGGFPPVFFPGGIGRGSGTWGGTGGFTGGGGSFGGGGASGRW